ncbi:GFA family protein [uncultured Sphingomonas sp.]|uniref:GFA family protein n=1 Tax=uncultured Sphingomonas sp. TaxID=158754 RepID=UPI0035CAFAC9
MTTRRASCRCGQLAAVIEGEPVRVSVCHCRSCQLRTGGAFAAQARFAKKAVTITGDWNVWERMGGSGAKASYRWCPACGATVAYVNEGMDDVIAISLGAIVEGPIPAPEFSMYEDRKLPWVEIVGEGVVHD